MGNRLSFSQIRLYGECGQRYKFHYVDKLREKTKSGALFFGTAIDKTFEEILKNPSANAGDIFDEAWTNQEINVRGKKEYLPTNTRVVYAQSDMDFDLITEQDRKFLEAKRAELVPELSCDAEIEAAYAECAKFKKQRAFRHFKENENIFLNLCNWVSLRRKGHLMIEAFKSKVLPKITRVVGTQVKVELKNAEGDSFIGFADLVCHWEGSADPVVLDFKTSSIEYDADAVVTSPQLASYGHALAIKKAGFVVFRKGILKNKVKTCSTCGFDGSGSRAKTCTNEATGKRCGGMWNETISPEVDVQILIDDIPVQTENIVLENIDAVNKAIHAGVFVRNFGSCHGAFGSCPFIRLCFNNSKEDLESAG